MSKPVVLVLLEKLIKLVEFLFRCLGVVYMTPFTIILYVNNCILFYERYSVRRALFQIPLNAFSTYFFFVIVITFYLGPTILYWMWFNVNRKEHLYLFLFKCICAPIFFILWCLLGALGIETISDKLNWTRYNWWNDIFVHDIGHLFFYWYAVQILMVLLSIICAVLNPVRFFFFIKNKGGNPPVRVDRNHYYHRRIHREEVDRILFHELILKTFLDYVTFPFIFVFLLIPLRTPYLFRKTSWNQCTHRHFLRHGFGTLSDLPCLIISTIIVCLTIVYIPTYFSQLYRSEAPKRRNIALKIAFKDVIMGIPHLIFLLILFLTFWRSGFIYKRGLKKVTRKKIRQQFLLLLLDFPCTFFYLVVTLTHYRRKRMLRYWNKLKRVKKGEEYVFSYHMSTYKEFLGILVDIPYSIISLLTLWRLPLLFNNVVLGGKKSLKTITDCRKEVLHQLKETGVDILFFVSFLILVASLYHIYRIYRIRKSLKRKESFRRKIISCLFYEFFLSIHICLFSYILLLTIFRFPTTIRHLNRCKNGDPKMLRRIVQNHFLALFFDFGSIISSMVVFWRIGKIWKIYRTKKFLTIPKNKKYLLDFWGLVETQTEIIVLCSSGLSDVLLFFLSITASVTLWRAKVIFYAVFFWKESPLKTFSLKFWWLLSQNLVTITEPILFLIVFPILYVSWRRRTLLRKIRRKYRSGKCYAVHYDIFSEMLKFCTELPLVLLCLICVIITPFRIPKFVRVLYLEKTNDSARRRKIHEMIAHTLVDLVTFLLCLMLLIFVWRVPSFIYSYFWKNKRKRGRFRKCVYDEAKCGFLDLVGCIEVIVIFFFMFDVVEWLQMVKNVTHQWWIVTKAEWSERKKEEKRKKRRKRRKKVKIDEYNGQELFDVYIPREILMMIFGYLPMKELIHATHTCSHFSSLGRVNLVWRHHYNNVMSNKTNEIVSPSPQNKSESVYTSAFREAFGSRNFEVNLNRLVMKELKKRRLEELRRREKDAGPPPLRVIQYEKGARTLTHLQFLHTIWTFPYSLTCFHLKLLGFIVFPFHLFNEFTNSWGMYVYKRVFLQYRSNQIQTQPPLPETNFLNWSDMHKYTLLAIFTFTGLMLYYSICLFDIAAFLLMFVMFLGVPIWADVRKYIPYGRNFVTSTKSIGENVMNILFCFLQMLTLPLAALVFLNLVVPPFFFDTKTTLLSPLQEYVVQPMDIVTPLFSKYLFPREGITILSTTFIEGFRNYSTLLTMLKLMFFEWISLHLKYFWLEMVILEWIVGHILFRFVRIDSWFCYFAFPVAWFIYFLQAIIIYNKTFLRRFFPWYDPFQGLFTILANSVYVPSYLCFSLFGILGEIAIIPYVLCWITWPICVVVACYMKEVFTSTNWLVFLLIPSVLVSIMLIFFGKEVIVDAHRKAGRR